MNRHFRNAIWASIALVLIAVTLTIGRSFIAADQSADGSVYDVLQQPVRFAAKDGPELAATLYLPQPMDSTEAPRSFPGAVFLSPYLESSELYAELATTLCRSGVAVLLTDVRHSGASVATSDGMDFSPESFAGLHFDALAALNMLAAHPAIDQARLALLGSAVTARTAVVATQQWPQLRALLLVSAVLDPGAMELLPSSANRPTLTIVSMQDGPAAAQARTIFDASRNPDSHLEVYINAGEGSDLWRSHESPAMQTLIHDWLLQQLSKRRS